MSSSSVILASKSPRRENILKQIGIDFEIIPSNICENAELNLSPRKFVQYWSKKKAKIIAKKNKDKTIILTGAMIPISFGSSDGLFNLGSALSFVQVIDTGVYITMNGRYFPWDNVHKNKKLGIFEKIKK